MSDVVRIGNATLYLGDCMDILPTLDKIDCVITDPPYNAKKDYGTYKDNLSDDDYAEQMGCIVGECLRLSQKQFWVAPRYKMNLWTGLLPKAHLIVIRRGASGCLRGGWSDQFQTALAIGKPNRAERDLWDDIRLKGEGYFFREETYGHPGYTPFKIMMRAVELMTCDNDMVLDPYFGTGTTGVACLKQGRKFIGIEIDPDYFKIACDRIELEYNQGKLF